MEEKDAVIVGARCAGSSLAIGLAERGWDVLLVDRDTFPSETISTHGVYPNTLARLEELGVMDTLRASHQVALLAQRLVGLGRCLRRGRVRRRTAAARAPASNQDSQKYSRR